MARNTGPLARAPSVLLLTPSQGLGGGIERVARSVEEAWPGTVERFNMSRPASGAATRSGTVAKVRFAARAAFAGGRRRYDWVCCNHAGLLPVAAAVARIAGARLLLIAHGREVFGGLAPLERRMAQRCDRILAVSHFTADVFVNRVKPREIPTVVHLPVPTTFQERATHSDGEPVPGRLLSVGRIANDTLYKGWDDVASAVGLLRDDSADIRWQMVGDGEGLQALREHCAELGILDRVDFTGSASDRELSAAYCEADVFVMPSVADPDATPPIGEGFGLVYVEAGAYGVPSIASSHGGGALDFVQHGITGLTVPPHAPQELAHAITRLVHNRAERDRLGETARTLALAEHSKETFAQRLASLIGADVQQLANRHEGGRRES